MLMTVSALKLQFWSPYLKKCISDEYIKYFAWKYEWKVDWRNPICALCEQLHSGDETVSTVDLDQVGQEAGCKLGKDTPWMMQR